MIERDSLPDLAARARNQLKPEYSKVREVADRAVANGVTRPSGRHRPPLELICLGLSYLLEKEMEAEAAHYAAAVKDYWGDGQVLGLEGDGFFGYHAIVYDWIHDALTPQERKDYGARLGNWLYWYTDTPEITLRNGHWRYNQTWGPAHLNTPNTRDGIAPKLFVSLALAGENTIHEKAARRFLDSWDRMVPTECIPAFDEMGGVWSESMGHGSYGPILVIPWAFEAWRTATGKDFFQLCAPSSYLTEMTRWAVHLTVPFSGNTAWIDDNRATDLGRFAHVAPILGARYRDPVANWVSQLSAENEWIEVPWNRLISYDPSIEPEPPWEHGYPLAHFFQQSGHVYMRGAWEDPGSTWAFFGAGPKFAGHSRDDEGHFLIARKGWLALRAGGPGHNDWDYYAGGHLAFNVLTIYDQDEQFRRLSPSDPRGSKNENDGGMIRLVYSHHGREDRAKMRAFHHAPTYTYAAADLTQGYRKNKVREVTRQFFYLRKPVEMFVIFDRVEATSTGFPKHWFLHIPAEPKINGKEREIVPEHVYSYTDYFSAIWESDPAGEKVLNEQGQSRAVLTSLLPVQATMVKRGGEGHQFWGHPDEPTAQYNHASRRSHLPPFVNWRLEVKAAPGQFRDYFLHTIQITDGEAVHPVELVEAEGFKVVKMEEVGLKIGFAAEGALSAWIQAEGMPLKKLEEMD